MPEAGEVREISGLTSELEAFVLKRDNIDFECSLPRGGKLWGRRLVDALRIHDIHNDIVIP